MLQSEEPLIYLLYKCQQRFIKKLATKFVKLDITLTLKEADRSFSELDISTENQKEDSNLLIGFNRNKLNDFINSGEEEGKIDSFLMVFMSFTVLLTCIVQMITSSNIVSP